MKNYSWKAVNPLHRRNKIHGLLSDFASNEKRKKHIQKIRKPGIYVIYTGKGINHWNGRDPDGVFYIGQSKYSAYSRLMTFTLGIIKSRNYLKEHHTAARRYQQMWSVMSKKAPLKKLRFCVITLPARSASAEETKLLGAFYRKFMALPPLNSKSEPY